MLSTAKLPSINWEVVINQQSILNFIVNCWNISTQSINCIIKSALFTFFVSEFNSVVLIQHARVRHTRSITNSVVCGSQCEVHKELWRICDKTSNGEWTCFTWHFYIIKLLIIDFLVFVFLILPLFPLQN